MIKTLFPDLSVDHTMMIDSFIDFICQNDLINKISTVSKFVGSIKRFQLKFSVKIQPKPRRSDFL